MPLRPLRSGARLGTNGRYRVERVLGQGGFGAAYLATDMALARLCVIKRLVSSPRIRAADYPYFLANFAREAQLLVSLNAPGHPNIPEIYEYLADEGSLVMKYIDGQSLDQLLDRRLEPFPEAEALGYARDVCSALVYLHSRSPEPVLHRDIKPANILLDATGRIWLIDFGLARALPVEFAEPSEGGSRSAGTLGYTAPEQWRRRAEPRSDVYALGATLHVLLTGYQPSRDEQLAMMRGAGLPPVRDLSPAVSQETEQLVARMMTPDVALRPRASEVLATLDALLQAALRPLPPPVRPPAVGDALGREPEIARYAQALATAGLAIITGPAGIGKTTLAAMMALREADERRVFWYSFGASEGVGGVLWALAALLARHGRRTLWDMMQHAQQSPQHTPAVELLVDIVVQLIGGHNFLLCLDDIQAVGDDPQVVRLLRQLVTLARAGDLRLILTSRHVPSWITLAEVEPLRGLRRDDARALLAARGIVLPHDLFAQLYGTTEGNPQFLFLASTALARSPDQGRIIQQLASSDDVERYLLYEVDAGLTEEARTALRAVAVLMDGGGTRAAVEALLDDVRAQPLLLRLVEQHLLLVSESSAGRVYRLHALVQPFYYEQVGQPRRRKLHRLASLFYERDELDLLRAARHALLAAEYEQAAHLLADNLWALINQGRAEQLRPLLAQCAAAPLDAAQLVDVALAQGDLLSLLRDGAEARERYQAALALLEAEPDMPRWIERHAQVCRGMGALLEAEAPKEALAWLRRGLDILAQAETDHMIGQEQRMEAALLQIRAGSALMASGDYTSARAELIAGLDLLPAGSDSWRAGALLRLGAIDCTQGDVAQGKAHYLQALELYRRSGNLWGSVGVRQNLAIELEIAGDWPAATDEYLQALDLAQQIGSLVHEADLLLGLGNLQTKRGDLASAADYLGRCLELARRHNLHEELVCVLSSQADLLLRQGQWDAAIPLLREAEALAALYDIGHQLSEIQRGWAQVCLAHGESEAALRAATSALAHARDLDADIEQGVSLRLVGQAYVAAEALDLAMHAYAESLALLAGRDPYEAARTRAEWGGALLQYADPQQGQAMLIAAQAAFAALGAARELARAEAELARCLKAVETRS